MSNAILNWRFGSWHLQLLRDAPYVRFGHNPYHAKGSRIRACKTWRWFERY